MKILMLGWELPPFNSGGLGVACYHLCKRLALSGVAIDFVLPYRLPPEHSVGFMRVYGVTRAVPGSSSSYDDWSKAFQLQTAYLQTVQRLLCNQSYDAIHAHDWLTFKAGILAKQLTGKPLVAHVHSTEFDRSGANTGNPFVHDIELNGLLMADRIIAVSGATKLVITKKYGIPADCIEVIHNAHDPALLTQPVEPNTYRYLERIKRHGYKVVVSIARLTVQKGMAYLLHAAQKALSVDPKLMFLIIGDGEQRNELITLSATLGIAENVMFAGFLRGKQWRDAYHIGDMFVMNSVSEPFGLTALEAASTNNAVLLTKQSGVSEILHSVLTFDFWDTQKLADFIINVAAEPTLHDTLAANARQEVSAMSWQKAADSLLGTYKTLAGAKI